MSTPTTNPAVAKGKENLDTKPGIGKCYRCDKPGHKSNEYPKRRQVNMANYGDEGEEVVIEDASDSDFIEEHRDPVACIVQRLLCNQKIPNTTQRHQIFYSRCSVKGKICNLVIDNGSCENIVSRALIEFETRDEVTSPSLRHWVDQERPQYQVNGSMSCPYFH